jgi:hypothetical protein
MSFFGLYRTIAVQLLGILLIFVGLNVLAWLALEARDLIKATGVVKVADDPWELRMRVRPGMSREDVFQVHWESWERQKWAYEPLAQIREAPAGGKFVNVTEAGYRKGRTDLPWPPAADRINVFVFGNSTTFGYGVPDWETVPSFLEQALEERTGRKLGVYNFAHGYYYSTHELLAFQRLVMDGIRPNLAVFIDGLNEFYQHDKGFLWTELLSNYVESNQATLSNKLRALLYDMPIWELYRYLKGRDGTGQDAQAALRANQELIATGATTFDVDKVLARYRRNQEMIRTIARQFGVSVLFVWQPTPTYKYDLRHHLFAGADLQGHQRSGAGYAAAYEKYTEGAFGTDFAWCADIQEGVEAPLYVDAVHYTARLGKMLAECIAAKAEASAR